MLTGGTTTLAEVLIVTDTGGTAAEDLTDVTGATDLEVGSKLGFGTGMVGIVACEVPTALEASAGMAVGATLALDDNIVVVTVTFGHRACIIPPFMIIPSSVVELADTVKQDAFTPCPVNINADWHVDEHAVLKSEVVHAGI